jgi:hypothetical protein
VAGLARNPRLRADSFGARASSRLPDDDDPRTTRFLPILGYVFGAFALMALLAFAVVTILRSLQ